MQAKAPTSLSHKQCVALSGELYRGWAGLDGTSTITFEVDKTKREVKRVYALDPDRLGAGLEHASEWA